MAERGVDEKTRQDCWKVMTNSEKVLLFLLIFTVLLLIGSIVYIGILLLSEPDICDSATCIKASADLLEVADFSSDPCEDFHKFTCGNYVPLQEDCEEIREPRKAVLSAPMEEDGGVSLATAKRFYQICIDVDETYNTKILHYLVSKIGGWPLIIGKHWRNDNFHWLKFIALQLRPRGIQSDWFFSFDYHVDSDGINLLKIEPPDLKKISNRHKKRLESMALAAGKLSAQYVLEDLAKVVEFEQELESITKAAVNNKNATQMTVQELNRLWPEIQLVHVLNNLTDGYAAFDNSTLVWAHEYYLYQLNLLLRRTDSKTQLNYLMWKIVESYLPFLSESFRQMYYEKYSEEDDIEDHCFIETMKRFYSSVESEMIKNKDDRVIRSVHSMANRILMAMNEEPAEAEVVIEGLQGENSGITNFHLRSHDIINMINEVHIHVENQFYACLHKQAYFCLRESYYYDSEEPDIRFNVNETTVYLSSRLLKSEMYAWDQPNFINYGRLGWGIADTVLESQQKEGGIDENISGVDLAYKAYVQFIQEEGLDGKLPAIGYSEKQLFWIHACTMYCKSENVSMYFQEVTKSEDFKNDFSC